MNWFLKRSNLIKYIICMSLLFIMLFLSKILLFSSATLEVTEKDNIPVLTTSTIENDTDLYNINVNYPRYKNENINKIITDWLYSYIKEFKTSSSELVDTKSTLEINYTLYYINEYVNIYFTISNSLNDKDISKNILINLNTSKKSKIRDIYSQDLLETGISQATSKYPSFVSEVILNTDLDGFQYLISDSGFEIVFSNMRFSKEVSYIPTVDIILDSNVYEEYEVDANKKMVALTFDDGPGAYSLEILHCLELNNASATFFELGVNMSRYPEITKELYNSGMEIGNHSYSHKYLTKLSTDRALEEINSTSIKFNEITGDTIALMRVPYGSVNSTIRSVMPFPIISWSIDTKDWLYKDSEVSSPIVLDHVKDGDIILMHDIHYATIELVKRVVPELKSMGYEVVTVSELAKYKGYTLEAGVVTREIKN